MRVLFRAGGKSPLVVFDDADLENAVNGALLANFYTQGEVCSNGTRVFVQQGLHDAFLARLVEKTRAMKIGDPMDPATQVGALISKEHCEKVLGYIERGRREGAAVAAGGGRRDDPAHAQGNFVTPQGVDGTRTSLT